MMSKPIAAWVRKLRYVGMAAALGLGGHATAAQLFIDVGGSDLAFSPALLTATVGDTVTFVNRGGFHNVAADDGSFRCARDAMAAAATAIPAMRRGPLLSCWALPERSAITARCMARPAWGCTAASMSSRRHRHRRGPERTSMRLRDPVLRRCCCSRWRLQLLPPCGDAHGCGGADQRSRCRRSSIRASSSNANPSSRPARTPPPGAGTMTGGGGAASTVIVPYMPLPGAPCGSQK